MYKAACVLALVALAGHANADQSSSAESTTGETTNAQTSSAESTTLEGDETTTAYEDDDDIYEGYINVRKNMENDEFDAFVKIINECRFVGNDDESNGVGGIAPVAYDDDNSPYTLELRTQWLVRRQTRLLHAENADATIYCDARSCGVSSR
jgi:hypothetical protein